MARSADRNNSFALTPSRGALAAPMLMPRRGCVEKPISYGFDILSMMRRAHDAASSAESAGKQSTEFIAADAAYKILVANAFAQAAGYGDENGVAAACPNLSFTSLKPSR